jgi:hypothetical protein
MADTNPIDRMILQRMGLSDTELTDMQTKYYELVNRLDRDQRESLIRSTPTATVAAATLGHGVTPEYLEAFIRAHAPSDATIVIHNLGGGQ